MVPGDGIVSLTSKVSGRVAKFRLSPRRRMAEPRPLAAGEAKLASIPNPTLITRLIDPDQKPGIGFRLYKSFIMYEGNPVNEQLDPDLKVLARWLIGGLIVVFIASVIIM